MIRCQVVPPEKVHMDLFRNAGRFFRPKFAKNREKRISEFNQVSHSFVFFPLEHALVVLCPLRTTKRKKRNTLFLFSFFVCVRGSWCRFFMMACSLFV